MDALKEIGKEVKYQAKNIGKEALLGHGNHDYMPHGHKHPHPPGQGYHRPPGHRHHNPGKGVGKLNHEINKIGQKLSHL